MHRSIRQWLLLTSMLVALFTVNACAGSSRSQDAIVGSWRLAQESGVAGLQDVHNSDFVYIFNQDGTAGSRSGGQTFSLSYRFTDESHIRLSDNKDGALDYEIIIDGNTLILKVVQGDRMQVFKRV